MEDRSQISDGYHTFEELYEHRNLLFLCLCRALSHRLDFYKAFDFETDGWFIVYLVFSDGSQISYHLPERYWNLLIDVDIVIKDEMFDGHSSEDVINRLERFLVDGL